MAYNCVMARYQPKLPPPNLANAKSWVGKPIRDAYANELGLVHEVIEDETGLWLLARFPGQTESRKIALEVRPDGEYLYPGSVKGRYRPPSDNDMLRLGAS
jgi:hypothetical protein